MQNDVLKKQVDLTLTAVLERGQKAVDFLEQQKIDEALHWLKLKKAGFFNFKSAFSRMGDQVDLQDKQRWSELGARILELDQRICDLINLQHKRIEQTIINLGREKKRIDSFRSRANQSASIAKSI